MGTPVTERGWMRAALAVFAVGWGANQFAPLLFLYRTEAGLSQSDVTAMFSVYIVGLLPTLLVAGRWADRNGRRALMRAVLVLSLIATAVMLLGPQDPFWLYLGRFLAGLASGAAFGAGSAWVRELSVGAPPGTGARRAAIALTGGFGLSGLVAGIVGEFAPAPLYAPYVPHLVLGTAALVVAWSAADPYGAGLKDGAGARGASAGREMAPGETVPGETVPRETVPGETARREVEPSPLIPASAGTRRFLLGVAPWAPLVFGCASMSFAVLADLLGGDAGGRPTIYAGVMVGVTLGAGMLVQPAVRRLAVTSPPSRPPITGLSAGALGMAAGAVLVASPGLPGRALWLLPVAVLLGIGYATLLGAGLVEVELQSGPRDHAGLAAVFYVLAYLGMATPYVLAELSRFGGPVPWIAGMAAVCVLLIPLTRRQLR